MINEAESMKALERPNYESILSNLSTNDMLSTQLTEITPILMEIDQEMQRSKLSTENLSLESLIQLGQQITSLKKEQMNKQKIVRALNLPNDEYEWIKYGEKSLESGPKSYFKCAVKGCLAKRYAYYDNVGQIESEYENSHNHESFAEEELAASPKDLLMLIAKCSLFQIGEDKFDGFGETFEEKINFNFPLKIQLQHKIYEPISEQIIRRRLTVNCVNFQPTAEMLGFETYQNASDTYSKQEFQMYHCKCQKCPCTVKIGPKQVIIDNAHNHHPMFVFNKQVFCEPDLYKEVDGYLIYSVYDENADVIEKLKKGDKNYSDESMDDDLGNGLEYPHL